MCLSRLFYCVCGWQGVYWGFLHIWWMVSGPNLLNLFLFSSRSLSPLDFFLIRFICYFVSSSALHGVSIGLRRRAGGCQGVSMGLCGWLHSGLYAARLLLLCLPLFQVCPIPLPYLNLTVTRKFCFVSSISSFIGMSWAGRRVGGCQGVYADLSQSIEI